MALVADAPRSRELSVDGTNLYKHLSNVWEVIPDLVRVLIAQYGSQNSTEQDNKDYLLILGLLADNIRWYPYYDPFERVHHIRQLCYKLDLPNEIDQLNSTRAMYYEFDWFRDTWIGPRGGGWVDMHNYALLEPYFDSFVCPHETFGSGIETFDELLLALKAAT
jgi:hypothetical protein